MRVAVLGANGQLGVDVVAAFQRQGDEVIALTHSDIEIVSAESVAAALAPAEPAVIVNTAAMHNVEQCEAEPQRAFAVNGIGVRNLALFARDHRAVLMHISTDYVFDGSKNAPYVESDPPLPLNVYASTKLSGEGFVRSIAPRHFVLRVCGIYGLHPCRAKGGRNFADTMLKIAAEHGQVRVVDYERVTPTYTVEVAAQIVRLASSGAYGLYHATAEGSCSWYEFAAEIFRLTNTRCKLEKAAPGEFAAKVNRPAYSVLENAALKRAGLNAFRPWQEGLRDYLAARQLLASAVTR